MKMSDDLTFDQALMYAGADAFKTSTLMEACLFMSHGTTISRKESWYKQPLMRSKLA